MIEAFQSATEVLKAQGSTKEHGLSKGEAKRRLATFGPNEVTTQKPRSRWLMLIAQFRSPVVLLLMAAATISALLGELVEGAAISAALVINAAIGFATEVQASRSMEALREMSAWMTKVLRGGVEARIAAQDIVPGDILLLEEGDIVPADCRMIEARNLECNESILTGESLPASKSVAALESEKEAEDAPSPSSTSRQPHQTEANADLNPGDATNLVFRGTTVTRGSGRAVAIATGMHTQLGLIADLVDEAGAEGAPLELRLESLAKWLMLVALFVGIFIAGLGLVMGRDMLSTIETAVILAIAAIPEGLPIVATVALARGMWRMAARNAIVNRLAAVETLGATSIILSDKTGTLTENRMQVAELFAESDPARMRAFEVMVLCNDAVVEGRGGAARGEADGEAAHKESADRGDPMEVGLLHSAMEKGLDIKALRGRYKRIGEEAFSRDTNMMATFHQDTTDDENDNAASIRVAVKGAPEAVLEQTSYVAGETGEAQPFDAPRREAFSAALNRMMGQGLRVLALAERHDAQAPTDTTQSFAELTLLGFVGLHDPPRNDVQPAIDACKRAGIAVAMVTGDHPKTARSIARTLGIVGDSNATVVSGTELKKLLDDHAKAQEATSPEGANGTQNDALLGSARVYARVSPTQKLELVRAYQHAGNVVAMTGDGVNDAPALKRANIGIAMGKRGTEAAKEASDIVLKDDAFATIVAAIEQGRVIFRNIRSFIVFLLSGNLGEILAIAAATALMLPLPLLPLQILFINLLLDVFPALALGVAPGSPDVMHDPPRHTDEPILTRTHWTMTVVFGIIIASTCLSVFLYSLLIAHHGEKRAVAIAFITFGMSRLVHVFNMRRAASHWFRNDVVFNRFTWLAVLLCAATLVCALYAPLLPEVLETVPLTLGDWGLVAIGACATLGLGQLALAFEPKQSGEAVQRLAREARP